MNVILRYISYIFWGAIFCVAPVYASENRVASKVVLVVGGDKCPAVDCDCLSVPEGKWQDLCLVREHSIWNECVLNAGKPKNYCGLHGPAANPVATSVQFGDRPNVDSNLDLDSLVQIAEAQAWSLLDDFKVLKAKVNNLSLSEASQVFGILRKNSQKLFDLQQQVVLGFSAQKRLDASEKFAFVFSNPAADFAQQLSVYGDVLWEKALDNKEENIGKAYKSLAFKISRESATAFERSAEFYASANKYLESAGSWQRASVETQKLLKWEEATSNKAKFVAFYQQQIAARIHRATLYWLLAGSMEQVSENIDRVRDRFTVEEEKVLNREKDLQAVYVE